MMQLAYTKYTEDQLDKIGNTLIYLTENLGALSKTKLLKLLYLPDEVSVKKSGIPFVNLHYDVWKFGPVDRDIYIELSSEPSLLKPYIHREVHQDRAYISGRKAFNDNEFSDNDMDLLDFVISKFGDKNSRELIAYTHKKEAPWYKLAQENGVLEQLENEEINSTDLEIDLGQLVAYDQRKKELFEDYQESH